jgi:ribonuclease D
MGRGMAEGAMGQAILEAVKRGLAIPDADCPRPEAKEPLPKGIGPVADLMKVLLKMKCEQADVAQRLVASADEVELIAAFGDKAQVHALAGWRRELFGEAALRLRRGELGLAVDGQTLTVVPVGPPDA